MRLLKEPLFHFLILGAAIFAWFHAVSPDAAPVETGTEIVVDDADVDRLIAQFEATWRRAPTVPELQRLMQAQVREEVLVREARKLGLDRGDGVIRARLAQKMEFLTTSVAQSIQPDDATLAAHLEENAERFTSSPEFAFEQVFLEDASAAGQILSALQSGADPGALGRQSLLPPALPLSTARTIDATFGRGFASLLQRLPLGEWAGPVASGYGQHVVRVTEMSEAKLPPLEQIRDAVLQDWRRAMVDELSRAQFDGLAEQYEITLPDPESYAGKVTQ